MLKQIALVTLLCTLTSCVGFREMHERWVARNCNISAAYNNGLTDGLTPGRFPNTYGHQCPSQANEINASYLKGFTIGVKSRPQEININKNVNVNHL